MKKLLPFIFLTLLFNCDSDEEPARLKFTGQVVDGDAMFQTPLKNVWVKITYYNPTPSFIKTDSVLTDESGNYSFVVDNDPAIQLYTLDVQDDYWFGCTNFFQASRFQYIFRDVDREETNTSTLNVCMTGLVKLVFTKSSTSKDTVSVSGKVGIFRFFPTKVSRSMVIENYYFSNRVSSVDYDFKLRKENGEVVTWTTTAAVEPMVTKEVSVDF
jgi:hypothetical protein